MKKILSISIAIILILSSLSVVCFAEELYLHDLIDGEAGDGEIVLTQDYTATLTEGLDKLYLNDVAFSPVDLSALYIEYYLVPVSQSDNPDKNEFILDYDKGKIEKIEIFGNRALNAFLVDLYYTNGSTVNLQFLKDDHLDGLNEILKGESDYKIEFEYPDNNVVFATKEQLYSDQIVDKMDYVNWYDVSAYAVNGALEMVVGTLYIGDYGDYYFIDSAENGMDENWNGVVSDYAKGLRVHKITDSKLISDLDEAEKKLWEDVLDEVDDEETTEFVIRGVLISILAMVLLVILILLVVKLVKISSKKKHSKG